MASGKKENVIRFVFKWIGGMEIPGGVGPCFNHTLHRLVLGLEG